MGALISAEDRNRILVSALLLSLPFAVIVLNSYVDQFFITSQGKSAVLAYAIALPVEALFFAIGSVLAAGVAVIVKRKLTAGDTEGARFAAMNAVFYSVPLSVISTVVLLIVLNIAIPFIGKEAVRDCFSEFLTPFVYFFLITTLNAILCGVMAAQGMRKAYTVCLIISFALNAVFDQFYIHILDLGVMGNAFGTLTGALASLVIAVVVLTRPNVTVRLSFRGFSQQMVGIRNVFSSMHLGLLRTVAKYLAELAIRTMLFTTFSLTYGVPMLYASVIGVVGSAISAALTVEFKRLFEQKARKQAYDTFLYFAAVGFITMLVLAVLISLFAPTFASVFLTHGSMRESRRMMAWTISILCFSAPFLGLREISDAVFSPTERMKYSIGSYVGLQIIKVIAFAVMLSISFQAAMYYMVLERAVTGVFTFFTARRFLLRNYGGSEAGSSVS